MFSSFLHSARLIRAAFALARYDALIPGEFADRVPAGVRAFGVLSRLTARRGLKGKRPGERLALALSGLGPAYIKLGQFLATRPDIIGFDIANDLGALQDKVAPFPEARARKILEEALGAPVSESFTDFAPAISAASIAQVHKATLASGETVAVKVLRPGVERACKRDMEALAFAARWAERLSAEAKRLEPQQFVDTVWRSIQMELDLRLEAAAASELAEDMSDYDMLRIPAVNWPLTKRRVLTTDWIEGLPVTDTAALEAAGVDKTVLANVIMQSFLSQALGTGFFHADLHPGNLFVDKENRLVLVDFGIMGRLDKAAQSYLAEILFGFLARDYRRVAEVHFEAGYVPAKHSVDAFAQALRAVGEPVFGKDAADISMADLLMQLFDVTAMFDMHLRPELVLLQKTMVTVEGVCRTLDPAHNMWEASQPLVEEWMMRRMGPPAHLKNAADGAALLGRFLKNLPETLTAAERAAKHIGEDGVRLDPETVEAVAKAQAEKNAGARKALWAGAAALIALALTQLF